MAALMAPRLTQGYQTWIQSLPTERPVEQVQRVCDIQIRFSALDFLQTLHRKSEDWNSWQDFKKHVARRLHEPTDWDGVAFGINTTIDAVIEELPQANSFLDQYQLFAREIRIAADSEWAQTRPGSDFPSFLLLYFETRLRDSNQIAVYYRQAHLAFELAEWRRIHGRFPETLEDLPEQSERIRTAKIDPFSGGLMAYERTQSGFRIYSVGFNCEDDFGLTGYDEIPLACRTNDHKDCRTGRWPDDARFEWPPKGWNPPLRQQSH